MLSRDLRRQDPFHLPLAFGPPDDLFEPIQRGTASVGDTVFFAVQPPPATAARISQLARHLREKHRLTGELRPPRCFHVSLLFAGYHGQMPMRTLDVLTAAAGTVAMPRFRVGFDWVESFRHPSKRPLVLRGDDGVSGLIRLRDRLVAATMDVSGSIPLARGEFTPHLTLLYDEAEIREEPIEEIGWPVTEFVLVRSVFGQSRHIVLRRWPLRG